MKRILFPTDFSPSADAAMQIAFDLAKSARAELVIFHAMNTVQQFMDLNITSGTDLMLPTIQPELVSDLVESHKKMVTHKMDELKFQAQENEVWCQVKISEQSLDTSFLNLISELNIGFIVMATKGSNGISETLIGSVAQKIVRNATVPVLTLRNPNAGLKLKKVTFFTDFLDDNICNQIPRVQHFAEWFHADLDFVFVNTPAYFEPSYVVKPRMNSILNKYDVPIEKGHIYNDFDITEGVINYGKHNNVSVLALVTHGFSGLKKLFNDNVTESIVNHSDIPVLSLHIPAN